MTRKFETRVTRITVAPLGEPIFCETATHVEIQDEAAGEFVKVYQEGGHTDYQKFITLDKDEWPAVRDAIDRMFGECRNEDQGNTDRH